MPATVSAISPDFVLAACIADALSLMRQAQQLAPPLREVQQAAEVQREAAKFARSPARP